MINIIITQHANRRIKERIGLKSLLARINYATRAYLEGFREGDCSGISLKQILRHKREKYGSRDLVLYRDQIFIFIGNKLITVLPIDCEYQKTMDKVRCRHNKKSA